MAKIRPFAAVRPTAILAEQIADLPYDVMSSAEAKEMVKDAPLSFLHVDKAEIDLPEGTDIYSDLVYQTARANLRRMMSDGTYVREDKPCFYAYRQIMDGRSQTGIVACASIDDYLNGVIKKHENTRPDKEDDRCRHVDACNAQTGPIFLAYRARPRLNQLLDSVCAAPPLYDFVKHGVRQTVWIISDAELIETVKREFAFGGDLYIADGHHRNASAVRVGQMRRKQHPSFTGDEEFNYYLCVLFADEQLYIMDYNRVVADLNGHSAEEFLNLVSDKFMVRAYAGDGPCRPQSRHSFGMYVAGRWYELECKPGTYDDADPVESLDVSILQNNLLTPVLGIGDPRTDKRIDFVGGIRGLGELERRVNTGMAVAFAMYPTSIRELMDIADAGQLMPPKSTWFEPKLLSGLFVHDLG